MEKTPILYKILLAASFALLTMGVVAKANAQTASSSSFQFLLTWKAAESYTPAWYKGKALPGPTSPITASLEIVANGKPVNLKGTTINWYLDNGSIAGGFGTQQITFTPDAPAGGNMELRVEIPSYNGNFLIHAVTIPVVSPVAVIDAPFPNGTFSGSTATVNALPYFFAVSSPSQLVYGWTSGGASVPSAEDPESAQINVPPGAESGSTVSLAIAIKNPTDQSEADASANLTYSSHL